MQFQKSQLLRGRGDFHKPDLWIGKTLLERYSVKKKLGDAEFGGIYLALHTPTKEFVEIEIIQKQKVVSSAQIKTVQNLRKLWLTSSSWYLV